MGTKIENMIKYSYSWNRVFTEVLYETKRAPISYTTLSFVILHFIQKTHKQTPQSVKLPLFSLQRTECLK